MMTDHAPVTAALNRERTRLALRFFHPTGNILTVEIVTRLTQALRAATEHAHLKLVTFEGAGADFSFGASVPEHGPDEIQRALPAMHELIYTVLEARVVTGAIVRGRCLGGGFELAMACDAIFAAEEAVMGLPEIALGVFPPAASALLPLKVGASRAARAILTGAVGPVADWRDAGLVERVTPSASLAEEIDRWFDHYLAPRSAESLRHAAVAARLGVIRHVRQALPNLERLYLKDLMSTADAAEGIAAFLQKRAPRWVDR
jgi:cyclohexa-1,5-dienecarbonyl-CoA hydratase